MELSIAIEYSLFINGETMGLLAKAANRSEIAANMLTNYVEFAERNVGPYPQPAWGPIETNLSVRAMVKSVKAERRMWHIHTIHKGTKAAAYHAMRGFFEDDME